MMDTKDTDRPSHDMRDRLIEAISTHVPFDGWGEAALIHAAQDCDIDPQVATSLFPNTARDLIAWQSGWADRKMVADLADIDLEGLRIRERVATAVMARLTPHGHNRAAVRAGLNFLALPQNAPLAAELLYKTVDEIWYICGDKATDWNFYSKRGLLAGVFSSTLLVWLDDETDDFAATRAFLDRRIENVMAIPKLKAKMGTLADCAGFVPRALKSRFHAFRNLRAAR